MSAPFFCVKFKKNKMENEDQKKPDTPSKMASIAFPKAKFGVYLALIIILIVLLIIFKDLIL